MNKELPKVYEPQEAEEDDTPDYPVNLFFTREGYFKKITPQSLRMSSEQKYKEGDGPFLQWEGSNRDELLVFTDRQQCYKARLSDFDDAKASVLGDYLPTKLKMDAGENVIFMVLPGADYAGSLLFFYENGKVARIEMKAYQTASNRRKLTGAYSDKSPVVAIVQAPEDGEFMLTATSGRMLLVHTGAIAAKATRNTIGVQVMTLKGRHLLQKVADADGRNQDGQRRGLTQRAVGDALDRNAQNGADDHRKDNGQHGVHTRRAKSKEHNIAADHDNVAVGEVQHLGNAVDHRIAQGDQRVNAAQTDTVDQVG